MSKPTDGRSWLSVKHRKLLTAYRDAAQRIVRLEPHGKTFALFEADGEFIEASQTLCKELNRLRHENRVLNRSLEYHIQNKKRDSKGRWEP